MVARRIAVTVENGFIIHLFLALISNRCEISAVIMVIFQRREGCGPGPIEVDAAEKMGAIVTESILSPCAIRDQGDLITGTAIININAADSLLIIGDCFKSAIGIKVTLVSVFVCNTILGVTGSGRRQNKCVVNFILIGAGRRILEIPARTVLVLPDIIRTVHSPLIDFLVIVRPPTMTNAVIVVLFIIGIIDMRNGDRHPITGKTKTILDPDQVTGKVIDMTGTGPSGTLRGIVPVVFQTCVV